MTRKAIIYFRNGGVFITRTVNDEDNAGNLGRRMCSGGFACFHDSYWGGRERDIVVNLADVAAIELIEDKHES